MNTIHNKLAPCVSIIIIIIIIIIISKDTSGIWKTPAFYR